VEDWSLAGDIMAVSDATRAGIQREMEQARRRENRAKAYAADERDEYASDRKLSRCKKSILRWLAKLPAGQHISRRDLTRKLKAELRPYFDEAIAELIESGDVVELSLERGTGYVIGTSVRRSTSQLNCDDDGTSNDVPKYVVDGSEDVDQGKCNGTSLPPGAPTERTPGMTDRVQQTLERVRNGVEAEQFDGVMCVSCENRPAGPQGWCPSCADQWGMPYSKHEKASHR
jgi:hypothetical protein